MWKEKYPVVLPKHFDHGEDEDANVYAFMKEMSNRLNEEQVIVVGNGSACVVGGHACIIKKEMCIRDRVKPAEFIIFRITQNTASAQ